MHVRSRGRVIVLSVGRSVCLFVCLFVCLSAPSQDFEQNRLVYGLYLLRMSQKLTYTNLTNESVLQGAEKADFHLFLALLKLSFNNIVDLYLERLLPLSITIVFQASLPAYCARAGVSALRAPLVT